MYLCVSQIFRWQSLVVEVVRSWLVVRGCCGRINSITDGFLIVMVAIYFPFWLYKLDSKACICMVGMFVRLSFCRVAFLCGYLEVGEF